MSIDKLRAMTTFIRTAELGSLTKAASEQQISPQAASKALGQLETYLGIRLFHRTTRSMSLTEEGRHLCETIKPSLISLEQALEGTKQKREALAGPLRIVAPRTAFVAVIGSLLGEYTQLYPEIEPDVQLDDQIVNWVENRVDVGFRLGNPAQEGLIVRNLFPMWLVICASPEYLKCHGVPKQLSDLDYHRCSAFRRSSDGRLMPWFIQQGNEIIHKYIRPAFSTNDEVFELQAVLAGQVVGQLALPTAVEYIRSGQLVPLLLPHLVNPFNFYIYYGSRTALPTRIRYFIDLVVDRLENNQDVRLSAEALMNFHEQGLARLA